MTKGLLCNLIFFNLLLLQDAAWFVHENVYSKILP
jgi:hypothetical protein